MGLLLDHAADPACEDNEGRNALTLAQTHARDDHWSSEDRDGILSPLQRAFVKKKIPEGKDGDDLPPKRAKKTSARNSKSASPRAGV